MRKENAQVGMKVIFGRRAGEKTRGIIVRLNSKKAKVKITQDRGDKSEAGQEWGVPYSMMEPDREHTEDMTQAAHDLNEAVMEQDLAKAQNVIRMVERIGPDGRLFVQDAVAKLILEATFHFDRTADDRDWEWLLENL